MGGASIQAKALGEAFLEERCLDESELLVVSNLTIMNAGDQDTFC